MRRADTNTLIGGILSPDASSSPTSTPSESGSSRNATDPVATPAESGNILAQDGSGGTTKVFATDAPYIPTNATVAGNATLPAPTGWTQTSAYTTVTTDFIPSETATYAIASQTIDGQVVVRYSKIVAEARETNNFAASPATGMTSSPAETTPSSTSTPWTQTSAYTTVTAAYNVVDGPRTWAMYSQEMGGTIVISPSQIPLGPGTTLTVTTAFGDQPTATYLNYLNGTQPVMVDFRTEIVDAR